VVLLSSKSRIGITLESAFLLIFFYLAVRIENVFRTRDVLICPVWEGDWTKRQAWRH